MYFDEGVVMVVLVGMCCCMGWLIGGFDYFV